MSEFCSICFHAKHYGKRWTLEAGDKSQKLTFWNFQGSSCFWKEDTRYKGKAIFINHIRTLLWSFLVWLFPQKSTQRTFKSRPERKSRHKSVTLVMEAGSTTRKGSSNSIANTHNRTDLYCACISSKVQPAEKLSLRKKERQSGSTSGHADIYYIRAQPSTYTETTHHISKTSFLAQ